MHHHLPALEVGVPERRRHEHQAAGGVGAELIQGDPALQVHQGEGEERGVGGDHGEGGVAVGEASGLEGDDGEGLGGQPRQGLAADRIEGAALPLGVAGLVGGPLVRDPHAVGIAAADVVLGVVDRDAVPAPGDRGLHDPGAGGGGGDVVGHLEGLGGGQAAAVAAEGEVEQFGAGAGDDDAGGAFEGVAHLSGQRDAGQQVQGGGCRGHGTSSSSGMSMTLGPAWGGADGDLVPTLRSAGRCGCAVLRASLGRERGCAGGPAPCSGPPPGRRRRRPSCTLGPADAPAYRDTRPVARLLVVLR